MVGWVVLMALAGVTLSLSLVSCKLGSISADLSWTCSLAWVQLGASWPRMTSLRPWDLLHVVSWSSSSLVQTSHGSHMVQEKECMKHLEAKVQNLYNLTSAKASHKINPDYVGNTNSIFCWKELQSHVAKGVESWSRDWSHICNQSNTVSQGGKV